MAKIGLVDSDLLYDTRHNFPNLCLMKLSTYHKNKGDIVSLVTSYSQITGMYNYYDVIYVSKVFKNTKISNEILNMSNVIYGGSGFFMEKAIPLPDKIEHSYPDYTLYNDFVDIMLRNKVYNKNHYKYYYMSIGYTTRGCFRKCEFCVNKNKDKAVIHSSLSEFVNDNYDIICLLDDNVLACSKWRYVLSNIKKYNKKVWFTQGLDIRLLTVEKIKILNTIKHYGNYVFAFDNYKDKNVIVPKLADWNEYSKKQSFPKANVYVLTGFDKNNIYDNEFYKKDVFELMERIKIILESNMAPYVMLYYKYNNSPYKYFIRMVRTWINSKSIYIKKPLQDFVKIRSKKEQIGFELFKNTLPELYNCYKNLCYKNIKK